MRQTWRAAVLSDRSPSAEPRRFSAVRCGLVILLAVADVVGARSPAWSQHRATVIAVDIPAQALDAALARFSEVSGMQMLYDAGVTAGRRSTAVSGRDTAQGALIRLLAGTGLRARFTAGGSVVITPAVSAAITLDTLYVQAAPAIGGRPNRAFLSYVDAVRREMEAILMANAELSRGDYRISLRLWLNADGHVTRSDVIASTASRSIQMRFRDAFQDIQVSHKPPDGLPQPIRIEFIVH